MKLYVILKIDNNLPSIRQEEVALGVRFSLNAIARNSSDVKISILEEAGESEDSEEWEELDLPSHLCVKKVPC